MDKPKKERLDLLLLAAGFVESRQKAQAVIMSGEVLVDDVPVDKPGTKVPVTASIRLRRRPSPYVGRGGEKLAGALDGFSVKVEGVTALDVGASTGGFTDCLLQRGAARIYAVDVGHNQLHPRLRSDPRVIVLEKTHARELTRELIAEPAELAVIDVSFIGLRKILDPVLNVLAPNCSVVALIKPQFELGPEAVEKGGVVRSEAARKEAVGLVESYAATLGLITHGILPSVLRGEKAGNQEYFIHLSRSEAAELLP